MRDAHKNSTRRVPEESQIYDYWSQATLVLALEQRLETEVTLLYQALNPKTIDTLLNSNCLDGQTG